MNNRDTSKMCPDYSVKGWSNQVGYGHIVQSTIQADGFKADAHPWNVFNRCHNQAIIK